MVGRKQAKRNARAWLRSNPGGWPDAKIYARDDGVLYGCQSVRLGYTGELGEFIEMVELRFADDLEPVFVKDRRGWKKKWPRAADKLISA